MLVTQVSLHCVSKSVNVENKSNVGHPVNHILSGMIEKFQGNLSSFLKRYTLKTFCQSSETVFFHSKTRQQIMPRDPLYTMKTT